MIASVCIATYRRQQRLDALLRDLCKQTHAPHEIVVVDNDPEGSAQAVVKRHSAANPRLPFRYDIQPVKNIALTRNRTVELATGDWLAFVDDDECAPLQWLEQMLRA